MKISDRDRSLVLSKRNGGGRKPGPKVDPDSPAQVAKQLGLSPSTYRNRLRRVAAGDMTLQEARSKKVMTRQEYSRLGGVAKHCGS